MAWGALPGGCPSWFSCWPGIPICQELEGWGQARGGEANAAEAAPDGGAPTLQGLERAVGISCAHLGSMGLLLPKRGRASPAPSALACWMCHQLAASGDALTLSP